MLQQAGLAVRTVGSPVLSVSNLPRILVTSRYSITAPHSCTALSSSTELGGPGGDWEPEIPFENLTEPGELVQPGQRWGAVPHLLCCTVLSSLEDELDNLMDISIEIESNKVRHYTTPHH